MTSFFVNGALAWATLALVAIPIIIHLINRRRFRRIEWAAMEFLLDALKKNRRRVRIEQIILLLLRIAVMALIGLFLARPVLSDKGLGWLSSALRSEDKIFILDDSFSTTRTEADRSTFQREVDALSAQIRRMGERGGGDRFTLLRGSRPEAPLARGIFVDRERAATLAQAVSRLSSTDTRLPLADALDAVAEGTAREGEGAVRPRAVSILTDLRATDWTNGQGGPDEALHRALRRLASSEERPARITLLDAGSDDAGNVAITAVSVEGKRPVAEIPAEIRVEVRNFGAPSVRGLGLRLRYAPAPASPDGEKTATTLGQPLDELAPDATAVVIVPCTFRTVGHYGLVAEVTGARDSLPGDDACALALEVVSGIEVLLVNGEPSSEPFEGETDFLAEALSPAGEVASGVKPLVVIEESIPRQDLARYAAVFIANLHSVPQDILPHLGRYVREGGTLVVFPGDQADATLYNRQMGKEAGADSSPGKEAPPERGLLPARIGELKVHEASLGIAPSFDHPYFRLLRDAKDLAGMVRFEKLFALDPDPAAQVIARYTDTGGSPAVVEHAVERGRVVLFASAADLEWNDWPRSPAYLMTLQEVVSVAARSSSARAEHLAGRPAVIPLDVSTHALQAKLRHPSYPDSPELVLSASAAPESGHGKEPAATFRFEIADTSRAGLHLLGLKTKSGDEEWIEFAVRRDPAESNLARVAPARLRELYPDVEIEVVKDPAAFADVGRGSFEVSDVCLWVLLGLLFVELFLARRFAHHPPQRGPAQPGEETR